MKIEIKVPAMGESISEATIGSILVPSGSKVAADAEILELETDKVNQVLYAPQAGVVQLSVKPEQTVKIGEVVGYVETEGAVQAEKTPEAPTAPAPKAPTKPVEGEPARLTKEAFIAEVKAPPAKNAEEKVIESPKETAAAPKVASDERESRRKMSKMRKVIASRLVEVQRNAAMLTTFNEVDMSAVMALREKYKEAFTKKYGTKLGFMSFFVEAVTSALKAFPDFNSYIDGDEIVHREYYDIGIAVGSDRGLFVPVLRDCDQLTFDGIERAIESYAKKAREGTISVDDLQGGGFTITNGGTYGSMLSTPILNGSQSGILGMHKIEKRAVVVDDQIVVRPIMYLALSYDHRIVDGKDAVTFLVHIKNRLEDPSRLLLEI
jgi:2-oxoglutarate dehydrogenase E2 component (dihydrolipoamide succinyltransferase)